MIYNNATVGKQEDGQITHLSAYRDCGREISSNNVKAFAAEIGCSVGRIYEVLRGAEETYPYVNSQRVKGDWFIQVMTKAHAASMYV